MAIPLEIKLKDGMSVYYYGTNSLTVFECKIYKQKNNTYLIEYIFPSRSVSGTTTEEQVRSRYFSSKKEVYDGLVKYVELQRDSMIEKYRMTIVQIRIQQTLHESL